MNIWEYWGWIEIALIIIIITTVLARLRAKARERAKLGKTRWPEAVVGKILHLFKYILRLGWVGIGTFLLIALVVIVERNIYSVYTETMPAPSKVEIPADLGFDVEEVTFKSEDGIIIAGWFIPSQNGATVILLHGFGANRTQTIWYAQQLVDAGYGVLMYDERGSGASGGDHRSYGWEDPRDVGGALTYLSSRGDAGKQAGILGCSIGAQIALQGAAYHPQIRAVWADGPSSVRAQDLPTPRNPFTALLVLGNYTLDLTYQWKLGIEAPAPMIDIIGTIDPRPVMIVAGGAPRPILGSESEYVEKMVGNAGQNAELWVIPEVTHCDGPVLRPDEYTERMLQFFDEAFGIRKEDGNDS